MSDINQAETIRKEIEKAVRTNSASGDWILPVGEGEIGFRPQEDGVIIVTDGYDNVLCHAVIEVRMVEDAAKRWGAVCVLCSEGNFIQSIDLEKLRPVVEKVCKLGKEGLTELMAETLRHEVLACIDYDRPVSGAVNFDFDNEFNTAASLCTLAGDYKEQGI